MHVNLTALFAFICLSLIAVIGIGFAAAISVHKRRNHVEIFSSCTSWYVSVVGWSIIGMISGLYTMLVCQFDIETRCKHDIPLICTEELVLIVRNHHSVTQWMTLGILCLLLGIVIAKAVLAPKNCRQAHNAQARHGSA